MSEPEQPLDVEEIADRARSLWRRAVRGATTARVELYVKAARRNRVTRDLDDKGVTFDRVHESGLALRAFRAGDARAGFAAAAGLSAEIVGWLVETACTHRAHATASAPGSAESVPAERWDLDAAGEWPSERALTTGLLARPCLEWVEAGTTVEVLVGADGWLAARRRHRFWALSDRSARRLVAQRGFAGWEQLLDSAEAAGALPPSPTTLDPYGLIVTPEAAAPLVGALVRSCHGPGSSESTPAGTGWTVADEPGHPKGLAGGAFDDTGFPARSQVLAIDGVWVGRLDGPGTFRRASFREPPRESPTNLVMPDGTAGSIPVTAAVARRCRVLRQSPELWVLELDVTPARGGFERRWVNARPETLLASCVSRLGSARLTAEGPLVPALVFERLAGR